MNEIYEQLASDFRPMLREIMRNYVEADGYVGLLFDLGEDMGFVAFAEAIYPPDVDKETLDKLERYPYQYSSSETFFLDYFRHSTDFADASFSGQKLSINDTAPQKETDQFNLYALRALYKDLSPDDRFGFWRLCLQQGKTQETPGLYLYFFDVRNQMQSEHLAEISKTSFFFTYCILSVLKDYQFVYHDSECVGTIQDLLLCMEGAETLPSMVRGEEKRIELIGTVAEKRGEQESELSISHDIDAPVGVLSNQEYDRLSDEGKLAVDYLEIWRRFAKRAFDDDLPRSISRMFSDSESFLEGIYRLAHARAMRRGVVPINEVSDEAFTAQELLNNSEYWLDKMILLPDELLLERSVALILFAKSWLLFFSIGAAHHTIAYAFSRLPELEDWEASRAGILRSLFQVDYHEVESGLLLRVSNRGGRIEAPEIPMSNSMVKQLSSSNFKSFPVYDGDRRVEILHGFAQEPSPDSPKSALWTAEIMIT